MVNYAVVNDYAEYMHIELDKVPTNCERLLARASELIEQFVCDNIKSNDANQITALKLATCAQVEFWVDNGEEVATSRPIKSFSSGDISISFADGDSGKVSQLSARTKGYLNKECLLYCGIIGRSI